jgi:DMSO reductase family type II enzyme chaperone
MIRISRYPHKDPIICSNLYKLLSIGFHYPTPEIFKIFQNGEFLHNLKYNISSIPEFNAIMLEHPLMVEHGKDAMKGMLLAEFEIKFTRIFDAGIPIPPCSPYEGHYCEKSRSMVMLEVSEFYNFFGLRMNQKEGKREFPDHISAELEFLHFLTYNEAYAIGTGDEENHRGYLRAQKDFLERHMKQWVPEFCLKLQNQANAPFYAQLAQIMSRFITIELELLTANLS